MAERVVVGGYLNLLDDHNEQALQAKKETTCDEDDEIVQNTVHYGRKDRFAPTTTTAFILIATAWPRTKRREYSQLTLRQLNSMWT